MFDDNELFHRGLEDVGSLRLQFGLLDLEAEQPLR